MKIEANAQNGFIKLTSLVTSEGGNDITVFEEGREHNPMYTLKAGNTTSVSFKISKNKAEEWTSIGFSWKETSKSKDRPRHVNTFCVLHTNTICEKKRH